ncbi:MAG: cardiolipin synthase [Myxococcota bacterium]
MDGTLVLVVAVGVVTLHLGLALWAGGHVMLTRREPTAAILWLLFINATPILGPVFYAVMGLHRVNRRHRLRGMRKSELRSRWASLSLMESRRKRHLGQAPAHVQALSDAVGRLCHRPLLTGNRVEALLMGERAYPRMLEAIESARHHVHLQSYIFDDDETGRQFLMALSRAAQRGVEVRLIYDAIGSYEAAESTFDAARRAGVRIAVARPLKFSRWRRGLHFRNHRKILVTDGVVGFTGGMNISQRYLVENDNPERSRDFHFRVRGPVVGQLQESFLEDWYEATGEELVADVYYPEHHPEGPALCRVITSSPAGEYEYAHSLYFQAISCAQKRVDVVTPYLIPDGAMFTALRAAVQRGASVNVLIPGKVDSAFVQAANFGVLPDLVAIGVNCWVREPPFLHAKVLVIDHEWATVGSANFDSRSFRFNDEVNMEVMEPAFIAELEAAIEAERKAARRWTAEEFAQLPLSRRIVQRTAALFGPTL